MADKARETREVKMPTPGLLNCRHLAVNKGQITLVEEKLIARTIADQDDLLERRIHSQMFINAFRNTKALMLYYSNEKAEATKLWKETVANDPTNINALQDLATSYSKLRNNKAAENYKAKYEKAINEATSDDRKMIYARCQIEQAYAYFWDLHTESWSGVDLRKKQLEAYEFVLSLAGDLFKREEFREGWRDLLLYTGQAHERLCHAHFRAGQTGMNEESLAKAINFLHDGLQLSMDSQAYQAQVWFIMGNALSGSVPVDILSEDIRETYKDYCKDPSKCYTKADELEPDCVWILGRLGVHHFKTGDLDTATAWLEKSINLADEMSQSDPLKRTCWNALNHRAKVLIKKAKNRELDQEEKSELLSRAKDDSLRAVEYNFSPFTLAVAGEVHHLQAQCEPKGSREAELLIDKALELFYEASIIQDGQSISNTHLKWARCLVDKGDLPSAIESYKIAFDTAKDTSGQFLMSVSREFLIAMLNNFKLLQKPQPLLKELAFWFVYIDQHFASLLNKFHFHKLPWTFFSEILDILEFIIHHAADRSDLTTGMLKSALDEMNTWPKRRSFCDMAKEQLPKFQKRVQVLCRQNTYNMNNPPMTRDLEPQPDDEHMSPNKALHDGSTYDFCVINDKDPAIDGWVKYSLLTGLETTFYGLKGFYHKRMKLGRLIYQDWANVIKESANALIVLSHDFDGHFLTEMAQEAKDTNVIVLQRKHVEVPLKLRVYRKFDFTVQPNIPELARYLMPKGSI